MGWEDRTYYSQGKLRVYAPVGSKVAIYSDNDFSDSKTATNGQCDFTVPGTKFYRVFLNDVFKVSVGMGYGSVKDIRIS